MGSGRKPMDQGAASFLGEGCMKIVFAKPDIEVGGAIVVAVLDGRKLSASASRLDRATKGAIGRALAASRFKGKPDDLLSILAPAGMKASRIVLAGVGKPEALEPLVAQAIGGRLEAHLASSGETAAAVLVDELPSSKLSATEV